jgi:hypothetical protein
MARFRTRCRSGDNESRLMIVSEVSVSILDVAGLKKLQSVTREVLSWS